MEEQSKLSNVYKNKNYFVFKLTQKPLATERLVIYLV